MCNKPATKMITFYNDDGLLDMWEPTYMCEEHGEIIKSTCDMIAQVEDYQGVELCCYAEAITCPNPAVYKAVLFKDDKPIIQNNLCEECKDALGEAIEHWELFPLKAGVDAKCDMVRVSSGE